MPKNYRLQYEFLDDDNKPYVDHDYVIHDDNDKVIGKGKTDSEGKTQIYYMPTINEYFAHLTKEKE